MLLCCFNFPDFVGNTTAASLFDKDPATYVQTPFPNRNFVNTGGTNPYLQLQLPEGVTDLPSHGHSVYKMKSLY